VYLHAVSTRQKFTKKAHPSTAVAGVCALQQNGQKQPHREPVQTIHAAPPQATYVDAPRFPYRGVMADVSRNFHKKDAMLRLLDVMAKYKVCNVAPGGRRLDLFATFVLGVSCGVQSFGLKMAQPRYLSVPSLNKMYGSGNFGAKKKAF
jgi:hypothetical protein